MLKDLDRRHSFDIAENCTFFHLRKAYRMVHHFYDEIMRPSGISASQVSLLNAIYLANKKLTISEFAKVMALDRTTLTRNMVLLEKKGLIKLESSQQDSRKKLFYLTKEGEEILKKGLPVWEEAHQALKLKIGDDLWQELMYVVGKIEALQNDLI